MYCETICNAEALSKIADYPLIHNGVGWGGRSSNLELSETLNLSAPKIPPTPELELLMGNLETVELSDTECPRPIGLVCGDLRLYQKVTDSFSYVSYLFHVPMHSFLLPRHLHHLTGSQLRSIL